MFHELTTLAYPLLGVGDAGETARDERDPWSDQAAAIQPTGKTRKLWDQFRMHGRAGRPIAQAKPMTK